MEPFTEHRMLLSRRVSGQQENQVDLFLGHVAASGHVEVADSSCA